MNKEDILLLYRYNAWANARILKAATLLTERTLTRQYWYDRSSA